MSKRCILLVFIALFCGCSEPVTQVTPINRPATTVRQVNAYSVGSQLIRQMLFCGFTLREQSQNHLVFECPSDEFWTNVFLGSGNDSKPKSRYRVAYALSDTRRGAHVVADCSIVTNPDSESESLLAINDSKGAKQIQSILNYVGQTTPAREAPLIVATEPVEEFVETVVVEELHETAEPLTVPEVETVVAEEPVNQTTHTSVPARTETPSVEQPVAEIQQIIVSPEIEIGVIEEPVLETVPVEQDLASDPGDQAVSVPEQAVTPPRHTPTEESPVQPDDTTEVTDAPEEETGLKMIQPDRIGKPQEYGYDANSVALWDVVPYQSFAGKLAVGVVAFHICGIDRVELSVKEDQWISIPAMSVNPRTQVSEYWTTIDAADFQDGPIELYAVAYPRRGNPRALEPLVLYANAGGSLAGNTVYVSHNGDDSNPGTGKSPLATITQALDKVTDGGTVVLVDSGVYELDSGSDARKIRRNDRYITIEPAKGLTADNVVIGLAERDVCSTHVARLRLRNLTMDFDTIRQYQPCGVTWFDGCRWRQSDEAVAGPNGTGYPLSVVEHTYYATDSTVEGMPHGFAGAGLTRNCTLKHVSADALQNIQCILNCTVENVDTTAIANGVQPLQTTLDGGNRIVYGLDVKDAEQTQCALLGQSRRSHTDCAFVDITFDTGLPANGSPVIPLDASNADILFRNVDWPQQQNIFDTSLAPRKQSICRNVMLENCKLNLADYTLYVVRGEAPPGVLFKDCYYEARGRVNTLDPAAARGVYEGRPLAFTLPKTDDEGNPVTYVAKNLPRGANFSRYTFEWVPGYDQAGTYEVKFVPSVGEGASAQPIVTRISVWNTGRLTQLQ